MDAGQLANHLERNQFAALYLILKNIPHLLKI